MAFISTSDYDKNYMVLDTIFAIDSHKEGFFSKIDPNKAFDGVDLPHLVIPLYKLVAEF